MIPDRIRTVPCAVKVISHDIDPVDMLCHGDEVEVPQIPVRRRGRKTDYATEPGSQVAEELSIVDAVIIVATAVARSWIFLRSY
ncbi:hypothetical protein RRF57_011066 [Xylaria bambusicola]|uniref:Uncharacterized protein n=1 Tax=Xylaria bambusicola TaxID=326684 RepID=A0AAN7UM66_9PEZI